MNIQLPKRTAADAPNQQLSRPQSSPRPSRRLRIFLVEDSAILRERLTETLGSWGNSEIVGHAETEAAAEKGLRANNWDVLVLDLQLLQGTGIGVLQNLKDYRRPDTLVIVLTNYVIPIYRTRAMQLGADYFFDKANEFARIKDALDDFARKTTFNQPSYY